MRRFLPAVALCAGLGALLAGCGGDDSSPTSAADWASGNASSDCDDLHAALGKAT